jgi:hypothetical protein
MFYSHFKIGWLPCTKNTHKLHYFNRPVWSWEKRERKKSLHAENVYSSKNIDTVEAVVHCCLDTLEGEIDRRIGDMETRTGELGIWRPGRFLNTHCKFNRSVWQVDL